MKRWFCIPVFRLSVVLALVVALVASAWAHRGPSVALSDEVLAYVAAGGSLDDLCTDGNGEVAHETCDACRLVDTVSLAGVADCASQLATVAATGMDLPAVTPVVLSVLDPARLSRAPPRLI
jgi:predicted metal-binding membrane protein